MAEEFVKPEEPTVVEAVVKEGTPYVTKNGEMAYMPTLITSYSQLDEERAARKMAWDIEDKAAMFPALVSNIMNSTISDKTGAIKKLGDELTGYVDEAISSSKKKSLGDIFHGIVDGLRGETIQEDSEAALRHVKSTKNPSMAIFKTVDGKLAWMARFSNNFIDNDLVPDILTADAHRKFVQMVDSGEVAYPELWLAHIRGTRIGKATWVAFDEENGVGFALAAGIFDPGMEQVAHRLAKAKNLGVSHGMDGSTLERDPLETRLITTYVTEEISPLPMEVAANKLTDFIVINKGDNMLDPNKAKTLQEMFGLDKTNIEAIEANNSALGKAAAQAGVLHKQIGDTEEAPVAEPAAEPVAEPAAEPVAEPVAEPLAAADGPFTKDQTALLVDTLSKNNELLLGQMRAIVAPIMDSLGAVTKQVEEVNALQEVSAPSLMEQLWPPQLLKGLSVANAPETEIDGRSSLSKDRPEASEQEAFAITPSPVLNDVFKTIISGELNQPGTEE